MYAHIYIYSWRGMGLFGAVSRYIYICMNIYIYIYIYGAVGACLAQPLYIYIYVHICFPGCMKPISWLILSFKRTNITFNDLYVYCPPKHYLVVVIKKPYEGYTKKCVSLIGEHDSKNSVVTYSPGGSVSQNALLRQRIL